MDRITFAVVKRQPSDADFFLVLVKPAGDKRRLAGSGRRGDQGQRVLDPVVQQPKQPLAHDHLRT
jgi:hypothetical protein